jgi:uroporphyrinogen III methyltransferase/synthase
MRIAPPEDFAPLDDACATVGRYDWVVFTSPNGVDYFFQRMQLGPTDTRSLAGVKLCAVGPGTAEHLAQHCLKADVVPPEYSAESVVDAMRAAGNLTGSSSAAPTRRAVRNRRTEKASTVVADAIISDSADRYRARQRPDVTDAARPPDRCRHLTSASTVRNYVRLCGVIRRRLLQWRSRRSGGHGGGGAAVRHRLAIWTVRFGLVRAIVSASLAVISTRRPQAP